ncbi:MAG: hypothetical protein AAGF47_02245, partial [Planctomycetota bacterium]
MTLIPSAARGAAALAIAAAAGTALAIPPEWETETGPPLDGLTDAGDDERELVSLPFSFPFAGTGYEQIWVYANGVVTLGTEQELDAEPEPDDLSELEQPTLAAFWSDINTEEGGVVRFNQFDDRAVITWDAVRSDAADDDADFSYTFQMQLFDDGTIVCGYTSGLLLGDKFLNANLVIGVFDGSFPNVYRFSSDVPFFEPSNAFYDFWPEESGFFPLENANLVFTPGPSGGFDVTDTFEPEPCPAD